MEHNTTVRRKPAENKDGRETSAGFASGSAFLFPPHFPHTWCRYVISLDQDAALSSLLCLNVGNTSDVFLREIRI